MTKTAFVVFVAAAVLIGYVHALVEITQSTRPRLEGWLAKRAYRM